MEILAVIINYFQDYVNRKYKNKRQIYEKILFFMKNSINFTTQIPNSDFKY